MSGSFGSTLALRAVLLVVALGLGGCAGMPFGPQPRAVTLTAGQVADALGKRIGSDRTLLDVFRVRIDKPKVTFDPQAQRLRADLDVSLSHPFSTQPLTGRAGISGGVAYDAKSLTVALLEPRIERFEIDGAPRALRDTVNRLGSALGGDLLRSYPLFTLKPRDLEIGGYDYEVQSVEVLSDAIRVTLTPKP